MTEHPVPMQPALWQLSIEMADEHILAFELAIEPFVESLMWTVDEDVRGMQHMEGFVTDKPDLAVVQAAVQAVAQRLGVNIPNVGLEPLAPRDWVVENLKDFPPIDEGRFFIYASHIDERPLPGRIPMRIDPGAAFGTGTHATTSGCLQALEKLGRKHRFKRPLDVGSGSGILAIAMAKLWHIDILGTDIDPVAVRVAKRNAVLNRVSNMLEFRVGPGFSPLAKHDRFDLIVANILARPLAEIAPDLGRHVIPGGYVILSGLLVRDERFVLGAYLAQGLKLESRHVREDWLTLVLKKR
ncbi:MAG: 50S ribosomal protein L11 methyltransferase [Magnetovibrio sp.]|nr:50S ribosomal protein L11 methyltransferase [Magnetovibrio sp.]